MPWIVLPRHLRLYKTHLFTQDRRPTRHAHYHKMTSRPSGTACVITYGYKALQLWGLPLRLVLGIASDCKMPHFTPITLASCLFSPESFVGIFVGRSESTPCKKAFLRKNPVRLVGTGVWTRDFPSTSPVSYHCATSLGSVVLFRGITLLPSCYRFCRQCFEEENLFLNLVDTIEVFILTTVL